MALIPGPELLLDPAGLFFALTAGIFTFFSPCCFTLLPVYLLYYLGRDTSRRAAAQRGLMSALGIMSVFLFVGLMAAYLGFLLRDMKYTQLSGLILVVMGIITFLDVQFPALLRLPIAAPRRTDLLGLYIFGAAYGLASIGCSLAIFLSVITYAITMDGFMSGFISVILYSLGIGIPMVLMAILGSDLSRLIARHLASSRGRFHILSGIALLIAGIYLLLSPFLP